MSRRFSIWMLITFILSNSFLLGRCSKCSNPSSSAIKGTVTLEQRTDHGGVTVRLYQPPEIDHDLAIEQNLYPNLGVPLNSGILFDHRLVTHIASTTTNASGSYTFTNVPSGEYIVVAEKDGYGYRERFDLSVLSGKETAIPQIDLLVERELAGQLGGDEVLDANRHYLVNEDVTVPSGITLTIEPGAHLKFTGYHTLYVSGRMVAVGTSEAPIVFTSWQQTPAEDDWRRIEFDESGQGGEMRWCMVEYANSGIYGKGVSLTLSHNVLNRNAEYGVLVFSTFEVPVEIKNHLLIHNDTGLWLENVNSGMVEDNIAWHNQKVGIGCQEGTVGLRNNLCCGSDYGLYIVYDASPVCRHNRLVNNDWGMACGGRSKPTVRLCDFSNNASGAIHVLTLPHGARAQPTINFCNFYETNSLIRVSGGPTAPNDLDIDATNNYWGGLSIDEIDRLIWDKNDVAPELAPHVATVNYLPMQTAEIDSAGLQ